MIYFHVGESQSSVWKKGKWRFIFQKLDLTNNFQSFLKKTQFLQCLNKEFSLLWSHACCNGQLSVCVCGTSRPARPSGLSRHKGTVAWPPIGVAQSWSLVQLFPVICSTANLAPHPHIWLSLTGDLPFGLFFPWLINPGMFQWKGF